MPHWALFWIKSISAIVDNAALTAAEIDPSPTLIQQRSIVMGPLISGRMLIPGSVSNIVAAGRLGIITCEWTRVGLLAEIPLMAACFLA
jgi:predicted cation transporter